MASEVPQKVKKTNAFSPFEKQIVGSFTAAFSPTAVARQFRKAVSRDRNRFQDFEYDLDLTYITNNIIAMGFPSSGIEQLWRNSIKEVCSMLNKYHEDHFTIWNLSGRKYSYEKFNQKVLDYGFPDHHSPPLELLFKIVLSMHSYLTADVANVSVVHCMGGKGRTGTVIACYLLYIGMFSDPIDALRFFAEKRSSISKGVIQASQIRYTKYFGDLIKRTKDQPLDLRKRVSLLKVLMGPPPLWSKKKNGCRPVIELYSTHHYPKKLLYSSTVDRTATRWYTVNEGPIIWNVECTLESDILLVVCKNSTDKKKPKKMFRFSFHCAFIDLVNNPILVLKLEDFDLNSSTKKKIGKWFHPIFEVRLVFDVVRSDMKQLDWIPTYNYDIEVNKFFQQMNDESLKMLRPGKVVHVPNESETASYNNGNESENSGNDLTQKGNGKRMTLIGSFRRPSHNSFNSVSQVSTKQIVQRSESNGDNVEEDMKDSVSNRSSVGSDGDIREENRSPTKTDHTEEGKIVLSESCGVSNRKGTFFFNSSISESEQMNALFSADSAVPVLLEEDQDTSGNASSSEEERRHSRLFDSDEILDAVGELDRLLEKIDEEKRHRVSIVQRQEETKKGNSPTRKITIGKFGMM